VLRHRGKRPRGGDGHCRGGCCGGLDEAGGARQRAHDLRVAACCMVAHNIVLSIEEQHPAADHWKCCRLLRSVALNSEPSAEGIKPTKKCTWQAFPLRTTK
jgi:hypothetical protein